MVSGFFTSPCDHSLILSGEASEIFTLLKLTGPFGFAKKLNSSSTKSPILFQINPLKRPKQRFLVNTFLVDASHESYSCSSISRQSPFNSLTSTWNDSGNPVSRKLLPLTIFSYIVVRPSTSSDLTVRNSLRVYAAP